MANTYKNIVITPNIGNSADPRIQFSGGNTTVNTDVNLYVYPDSNGTLSFEGSAGQLFSITNDLSNSLFAVSDVSGIPSLEIFANGYIALAPYGGNVAIGANSVYISNDRSLKFQTVNTSAAAGFRQQTDDNFVFYTTNTVYGERAVWSIFANSDTSAFSLSVPATFNANVTKLAANGTTGSAGQVLTANGTGGIYWSTVSGGGGGSVNVDAQYVWTNTQTFQNTITFSSVVNLASAALANTTGLFPSSNTIAFGNTTARWVINANTINGTGDWTTTGNVGIGWSAVNYAQLSTYHNPASDAFYVGIASYNDDANVTTAAARSKYATQNEIKNYNQNKNAGGTPQLSGYIASVSEAYNGSTTTGGDAFADYMFGSQNRVFNYANGANANTINNARASYNMVRQHGSGIITTAVGACNYVLIANNTVTGNITTARAVAAYVESNSAATIDTGILYYGSHAGTTTTNKYGIYLNNESNNYFSGTVYFQSNTIHWGNVGIGTSGRTDTRLNTFDSLAADYGTYGHFSYILDTNTALTAARNRIGSSFQIINLSQNKNTDGVTTYATDYRGVSGVIENGNSASGGDARMNNMYGGYFRVYNYATGANANTVGGAYGVQSQAYNYGSGVITTAYGLSSYVAIGNTTTTGNITTAYGVYSEVKSNTAATIGSGYLYYGQHTGSTTTSKYGLYLTGEANNYLSGNFKLQGTSYLVGNVGVGVAAATDTQLWSGITWTSDASLWNTYVGTTDSNATTTAARTKYGFQSSLLIQNQNKSADGLTQYQPTYRAVDARIYHGSSSTGGNAYAEELQAVRASVYVYANGTGANGANTVRGVYSYIQHAGGGNVNAIHSVYGYFEPANNSVTGTVSNVTIFNAYLGGNTALTVSNGYLFKGDYSSTNRPAVTYGLYITDEGNNYVSGNLVLGGTINAAAFTVGSSFVANTTQASILNTLTINSTATTIAANSTVNAISVNSTTVSIRGTNPFGDGSNLYVNGSVSIDGMTYHYNDVWMTNDRFLIFTDSANGLSNSFQFECFANQLYIYGGGKSHIFAGNGNIGINNVTPGSTFTVTGNVDLDSGTLFVDGVNSRVGINNNAPAVALQVTGVANISGNLAVGGTSHTMVGNLNVDSGTLYVDGVNSRVGINNTAPAVALQLTGAANISSTLTTGGNMTVSTNTFTLGTSTKAANGYTWLPNGLKMNWGLLVCNTTSVATYASPFATATLSVTVGPNGTAFIGANTVRVVSVNTTAALIRSTSTTTTNTTYYVAIGY